MPLGSGGIGEHGEMAGCVIEAGKLEPGIGRRAVPALRGQRRGVATFEIRTNGRTARRCLHDDESPRLAQSHRRREACKLDQTLQGAGQERLAPEAPDVTAPREELAQAGAEDIVEMRLLA